MNRNQLKMLAALAMLLDHIAFAFLPSSGIWYFVLRFFGRVTAPVMAYFLAEGYRHTRNVRRYALRLFLFALISWVPFAVFETGLPPVWLHTGRVTLASRFCFYLPGRDVTLTLYPHFSVLHTLLLGLLAVWLWDRGRCARWCKVLGVFCLCILAVFGDWSFYNVLFVLFFFALHDRPKQMWLAYGLLTALILAARPTTWARLCQLGMLLVPPLIQCGYNGEAGRKTALSKWGFYVFYPAHLLILGLLCN